MRSTLNYKQIINQCFNFQYAGIAEVFITMTNKKYTVCSSGFEIIDNIVFFKKQKVYVRKSFNTLFDAILQFNMIVRALVETLDWYKEDIYTDFNYLKKYINDNYVY